MGDLKRVSGADRKKILLSTAISRFWRRQGELREQAKVGPGVCRYCGRDPCGGGWGPMLSAESARCCHQCDHGPLEAFVPTHILWFGKKAFFVREGRIGKKGVGSVYFRQDGVIWFIRVGGDHYFLGRKLQGPDFARFRIEDNHGWPDGFLPEALAVAPVPSRDSDPNEEQVAFDDDDVIVMDDDPFDESEREGTSDEDEEDSGEDDAADDESDDDDDDEGDDDDDDDDEGDLEEGDEDEDEDGDGGDGAGGDEVSEDEGEEDTPLDFEPPARRRRRR